jgi:hypothetical protein
VEIYKNLKLNNELFMGGRKGENTQILFYMCRHRFIYIIPNPAQAFSTERTMPRKMTELIRKHQENARGLSNMTQELVFPLLVSHRTQVNLNFFQFSRDFPLDGNLWKM